MSYLQRRYGARVGVGLGGIEDIISTAAKAAGTALDVASDPYLPEVVCRLAQLKKIESGAAPGECISIAAGIPGGVGLRNAVVPLRGYVFAQQNKWVYPLAVAAIIGIPMWIGYEIAQKGE